MTIKYFSVGDSWLIHWKSTYILLSDILYGSIVMDNILVSVGEVFYSFLFFGDW